MTIAQRSPFANNTSQFTVREACSIAVIFQNVESYTAGMKHGRAVSMQRQDRAGSAYPQSSLVDRRRCDCMCALRNIRDLPRGAAKTCVCACSQQLVPAFA